MLRFREKISFLRETAAKDDEGEGFWTKLASKEELGGKEEQMEQNNLNFNSCCRMAIRQSLVGLMNI
jgi:hypothetical protein